MWSVEVVSVTGDEPVTLTEVKLHCRVDGNVEDALLRRLISTAREVIEDRTGIVLRAQTVEIVFDGFSADMVLPRHPVRAVEGVQYLNGSGQEVAVSEFRLTKYLEVPRLAPAAGTVWPYTAGQPVTVRAEVGFQSPDLVPTRLKTAMLLMIGDWYQSRETVAVGISASSVPLSVGVAALLADYRLTWL